MGDKTTTDNYLPYRDQRLADRKGELWKPIPGLETYFEVSNHGRVKRLKRLKYDALSRPFTTGERIIIPAVNSSPNIHKNDFTYRFQVQIQIGNNRHTFQVQRMVYYCFVGPFDLRDKRLYIVVKSGNGLDIRPENLQKLTIEEKCQRAFDSGRQVATFAYDPSYKEHAVSASAAIIAKQVSRYTMQGLWQASYSSITEAANNNGLAYSAISIAVKKHWQSPGGFYWRYGEKKSITIIDAPKKDYRESRGTPVTQYDLNGNPIGWFLALSEAAKSVGVDHKTIKKHINGSSVQAGGFLWRLGHHQQKLEVEKPDRTNGTAI